MRADRQTLAIFGLSDSQVFSTAQQLHAIAHHLLLNHLCRAAVLVRHDAVRRFDEGDVGLMRDV